MIGESDAEDSDAQQQWGHFGDSEDETSASEHGPGQKDQVVLTSST